MEQIINHFNPHALFEVSARGEVKQDEKTYEATITFFFFRETMPIRNGKEMKPKKIFGSKAKAAVAKEDYLFGRASELFSLEEVVELINSVPTNEGKKLHSFSVRECELPLPLGTRPLSMIDWWSQADRPFEWGISTNDSKYHAVVIRDKEPVYQFKYETPGKTNAPVVTNDQMIPF